MKKCVIITSVAVTAEKAYLQDAFVIAVDNGYYKALEYGIKPDLILGDWDSAPCPQTDIATIKLPPEKDDTDTFYAAQYALKQGYSDITILGGEGGRLDHTMANICTLQYLRGCGAACRLISQNSNIWVLFEERLTLSRRENFYLSVYALTPSAVIDLEGVKYPLTQYCLKQDIPLGTSNEIIEKTAKITVYSGKLLVIQSFKQ